MIECLSALYCYISINLRAQACSPASGSSVLILRLFEAECATIPITCATIPKRLGDVVPEVPFWCATDFIKRVDVFLPRETLVG